MIKKPRKLNSHNTLQKLYFLDYHLLVMVGFISIIGFVLLYSAAQGSFFPWLIKQMAHFTLGLFIAMIISMTNLSFWYRSAYKLYFLCLFVLIITELFGYTAMGATRWLNLGIIKLQPSEPMKITLILALARYFHNTPIHHIKRIKGIIIPIVIVLLPTVVVLKQPDLGTAAMILGIGAAIFFIAGIALWKFAAVLIFALISAPIAWKMMHEYQRQRIIIFLNPEVDRLGSGYNIIQSKIAIGSGGIFGKGLIGGTQTQLNFLPEHQTDFIFTMLAEELGLVGGIFILIIYGIILFRIYKIAFNSQNHFGAIVSLGVASMIFVHFFINIAMVMGLVPVVGVPLPFLSYGGTIMISMMVGIGFVLCSAIHNKPLEKLVHIIE